MCLFIHVLLPNDTDMSKLEPLVSKYALGLLQSECSEAVLELRPDDWCFSPTMHVHCDCGTDLGSWKNRKEYFDRMRRVVNEERSKRIQDEKEGANKNATEKETPWGRFKKRLVKPKDEYDRIADYEETLRELDEGKISIEIQVKRDVDLWLGFIRKSLEENLTNHVGVILHWASGSDTRPDEIEGTKKVPLYEVTERALRYMEMEVLYEFVKE